MRLLTSGTRAGALHPYQWPGIPRLKGLLAGCLLFTVFSAPAQALPSVTLAWNPSPDPSVVSYKVYYGVASHTYTQVVDAGKSTNATLSGLVAGVTYYFAVTAYNSLGLESSYSNEVGYTVPANTLNPRLQIRITAGRQAALTGTGTPGHTYEIRATTNLRTWTVIGLATAGTNGIFQFIDSAASNLPARFYRARDTQL